MDEIVKISDRLAYYRIKRGLSKKELAEICGISPAMIAKYENGETMPSLDTIAMVSTVLGVTMNRLLCGYDEEENPIQN